MSALPKPEVILTHESDLDGFLSGLLLQRLARHLFGEPVRLEAYHYNYWKQRDLREKSAWVTDFTFEARMDKPDWVVMDHHVTEVVPKKRALIHDVTKSAGLLCYELCQAHGLGSPTLDRLVHLNDVADLFLENDPDFHRGRRLRELGEDATSFGTCTRCSAANSKSCWTIRCWKSWPSNGGWKTRSAWSGAAGTSSNSRRQWPLWIPSLAAATRLCINCSKAAPRNIPC